MPFNIKCVIWSSRQHYSCDLPDAIFSNNKFFSYLRKKSHQANRVFLQANYFITDIMLFGLPLCSEVVKFSSHNDERSRSVGENDLKNYKGNERSEYEPKANKFIFI